MFLTIITIHLNNFNGLLSTYQSLRTILSKQDVEWIVIDGGSFAQTNEQRLLLDSVQDIASRYISEPDDGIYDAMNKGTHFASGDYILYLNAGDDLHPEFPYDKIAESVQSEKACMIWGSAHVLDQNDRIYARKTRHPRWLRYGTAVCHQAIFFNHSMLGSNPYDTGLNIAADYDLICRLYISGVNIKLLDVPVCVFDLIGKSGLDKRLTLREESVVRQKHFMIPRFFNRAITEFKYIIWQAGILIPAFRRAWSRIF